jgi:hypothetical protein
LYGKKWQRQQEILGYPLMVRQLCKKYRRVCHSPEDDLYTFRLAKRTWAVAFSASLEGKGKNKRPPCGHNNKKLFVRKRSPRLAGHKIRKLNIMSKIDAKTLLEAGVHFGHRTDKWNPKMKPFIYEARNGIHIINLSKTSEQLEAAANFLKNTAAKGGKILFVGC